MATQTKTTLGIDGMMCSMCESHINDTLRNAFGVKKVTSSHRKGQTEVISDSPLDEAAVRAAIAKTGYEVTSFSCEPYKKKGFFGR